MSHCYNKILVQYLAMIQRYKENIVVYVVIIVANNILL